MARHKIAGLGSFLQAAISAHIADGARIVSGLAGASDPTPNEESIMLTKNRRRGRKGRR